MTIDRVAVIGGGQMGAGIAEVCARAGAEVVVVESDGEGGRRALARIDGSLDRAVRRGKLEDAERRATIERIGVSTDLAACADRQLVIEAIVEDADAKIAVLSSVNRVLTNPKAILATNTSSIPIMKLAAATGAPERVVGLHFFNPVPVMPVVEVITTLATRPEVVERVRSFATDQLGKSVIDAQDRAGFVVNSLLIPYLLSAIRMLESGYASAEDIDAGMRLGCGHPMGPLELADLIGLDTVQAIAESMYAEHKEPLYAPPPLLSRMTDAGLLGRKSGRGFGRH
ncbi:MAG: 3-hydroxybutyryl-CoA dehydrogenase [Aeromicrobium sp.]|uniref:3-hydroxybutyryl-CoA dehydrogenase n=1 Tax=Aeromicrobium sp. TaxID=1871063 RepID=UPI0039E2A88F